MNSFIPWVGGKGKLLWIINKLMPDRYTRFIDVFGGSGTVTMCRPIQRGCMEVYNDFNGNLTNLFCCVKNRPMALLAELGFLPLNTRDDFNVLYKFFSKGEFAVRFVIHDNPGVLAAIAAKFADHGVSINGVNQDLKPTLKDPGYDGELQQLRLVTHMTDELTLRETVKDVCELDCVCGEPSILRVLN